MVHARGPMPQEVMEQGMIPYMDKVSMLHMDAGHNVANVASTGHSMEQHSGGTMQWCTGCYIWIPPWPMHSRPWLMHSRPWPMHCRPWPIHTCLWPMHSQAHAFAGPCSCMQQAPLVHCPRAVVHKAQCTAPPSLYSRRHRTAASRSTARHHATAHHDILSMM